MVTYGDAWTKSSAPFYTYLSIASSSSGKYLAAGIGNNDWYSIISSSSGQHLAAVENSLGLINVSSNYGSVWYESSEGTNSADWVDIASSYSGQHIVVGDGGGSHCEFS